ncbi:MAG: hypothetical protein LBP50_04770, partial [Tannerella sp.]|nr:hypothetical protein [Tannerella sp.]
MYLSGASFTRICLFIYGNNSFIAVNNPVIYGNNPVIALSNPVIAVDNPVIANGNPVIAVDNPVIAVSNPVIAVNNPVIADGKSVRVDRSPVIALPRYLIAVPHAPWAPLPQPAGDDGCGHVGATATTVQTGNAPDGAAAGGGVSRPK